MKIYLGFDQKNKNIRILSMVKNGGITVHTLKFQSILFSDEFFSEFHLLLSEFAKSNSLPSNTMVYIVMPDNSVSFETFDLPNMNKGKMQKALDTELANEYGTDFLKDKELTKFLISSTRQFVTYGVNFEDKKIVAQLNKIIREIKLIPRSKTYSGAALINSVFHMMPRARGKSFIIADIRADNTEIVMCSKGKIVGVANYPQGVALINSGQVCDEYNITDHTIADIAVINAREIARAKALTMSGGEDENISSEMADEAVQAAVMKHASATAEPAPEQTAEEDDEPDDEDIAEESADGTPSDTAEAAVAETETLNIPNAPKVKVYKKQKRRIPKFMQREIPEETSKIAYENFRIILKWILLYARQAHMTPYITETDYIIINLPEKLNYLLEMANEEQAEGGLLIRALKGADKKPAVVTENLDLYGASFGGGLSVLKNLLKKS